MYSSMRSCKCVNVRVHDGTRLNVVIDDKSQTQTLLKLLSTRTPPSTRMHTRVVCPPSCKMQESPDSVHAAIDIDKAHAYLRQAVEYA